MFTAFLIKYAEIGVKGKNRYLFEDALVKQIKYALKKCDGEFVVRKTDGRIYVDAVSTFDFDETVAHLQKVFGISGICPVVYVEDEGFEKLGQTVVQYIDDVYSDKRREQAHSRFMQDVPEKIIRSTPWKSIWRWGVSFWMLILK